MRTTSPIPVYRSSRDTRNSPLWNPSSRDLLNVEEDEAGRLAGFRARFGKSFDASKEVVVETTGEPDKLASEEKANVKKVEQEKSEYDIQEDFGDEDDESLLEMISSFGKADKGTPSQIAKKKI